MNKLLQNKLFQKFLVIPVILLAGITWLFIFMIQCIIVITCAIFHGITVISDMRNGVSNHDWKNNRWKKEKETKN